MRTFEYRDAAAEFARHIGAEYDAASKATAALRVALIAEEAAETLAAMCKGDIIEAADGLADLRYVVMGAAAVYGYDVPDWDPKPTGAPRSPMADDALSFCHRVIPLVGNTAEHAMTAQAGQELAYLDEAVALAAASLGYPLDELFWETHRSNMTKAPGNGIGIAKYGPGGKGPNYRPPDIAGVLARAAGRFKEVI
jgi:predicted HAD superfamily Cof-like phosphohydrolase